MALSQFVRQMYIIYSESLLFISISYVQENSIKNLIQ